MNYQQLIEEVRAFKQHFEESGFKLQSLVGWKLLFSPLKPKPKILLMGINPGGGEEGDQLDKHKEYKQLEYLSYSYTLANETKSLFQQMGHYALLENNTVKANCFYYSTASTKGLEEVIHAVNKYYENHDWIYRDQHDMLFKWTQSLVLHIIQPRIIICEGKMAYQFMDKIYHPNHGWTEMQRYDGISGYWQHENGRIIFGYSRNRSRIRSKEEVGKRLKPILDNLEFRL